MSSNSDAKVSDPNADICMATPEDRDHRPIQRSRRRKVKGGESCHAQKKKQSQRGMGVAQLERLRIQEWKKMTEIITTNQALNFPVASSFMDLTPVNVSGPVHFPKMGGFGAPNIAVGKIGFNNPNERLGFNGQVGFGGFVSSDHHFKADLFEAKGSNDLEAISSDSNGVKSCTQLCIACQEKQKISGQNLSCSGMKPDFSGCGFLGLNVGQTTYMKRDNQGFATKVRPETNVAYTVRNGQPGVEIVAVHNKGSSSSKTSSSEAGNALVMEYEFFPSGKGMKSNINPNNNDYVMMKLMAGWGSESVNIGDQSCCVASSNAAQTGFDGSTGCIDLSLKLSY